MIRPLVEASAAPGLARPLSEPITVPREQSSNHPTPLSPPQQTCAANITVTHAEQHARPAGLGSPAASPPVHLLGPGRPARSRPAPAGQRLRPAPPGRQDGPVPGFCAPAAPREVNSPFQCTPAPAPLAAPPASRRLRDESQPRRKSLHQRMMNIERKGPYRPSRPPPGHSRPGVQVGRPASRSRESPLTSKVRPGRGRDPARRVRASGGPAAGPRPRRGSSPLPSPRSPLQGRAPSSA